ncbi:MAG: V-type ATP synthase subunit F [Candidatus Micrarchaeaceae archaeon]
MTPYKIAIIGNELLCTGFELAGVDDTYLATTAEQAQNSVKELLNRQDIGIIGIGSGLLKDIEPSLLRKLEISAMPIVVALPDYGEPVAEDELRGLIIRAIGIDLERG